MDQRPRKYWSMRVFGYPALAAACLFAVSCTREDDQRVKTKLKNAEAELKQDAHKASKEIQNGAHKAERELKQGSDKLKQNMKEK